MLKQAIIVPMWLGMTPGKVASQCCHVVAIAASGAISSRFVDLPRIVLRVTTKKEISVLWQKASLNGNIGCCRFKDSAPTTEDTANKFTAYCFTGRPEDLDPIFGHLELY